MEMLKILYFLEGKYFGSKVSNDYLISEDGSIFFENENYKTDSLKKDSKISVKLNFCFWAVP